MSEYQERSTWPRRQVMLSINDPRWGRGDADKERLPEQSKRPQDGPPDLDEMWRDFNRRLRNLFGIKRKTTGGGGPGWRRPGNGRMVRVGLGIIIGVLIAVYFGSGIYIVQENQVGVVLQLGKYRETVEPGVHWCLPYPFETLKIVNVAQVRSAEIGHGNVVAGANTRDASMLTHDGDIVDMRFTVQYRVKTPTDYLLQVKDPDQSVRQAARSAARQIVGGLNTEQLFNQDREIIRQSLKNAVQHSLDQLNAGLTVVDTTLPNITVPQQMQSTFDAVTKARQDRARAKQEAQAYADELLPRAQAEAISMINDAKSYSNQVVARAEGDAQRFLQIYAQYSKAPAVIRNRLYLETMQHIYSNVTKVYTDGKAGSNMIYLPLDKLAEGNRQHVAEAPKSASAPSAEDNASGAASPNQAASEALRSRDTLRRRGREDDLPR